MKYFLTFLIILSVENSLGAPCNGAPGKFHVNPDGSQGGFVQNTARVSNSSYIDETSEICDKVDIKGSTRVLNRSSIRGSVLIEGQSLINASQIFGQARVKGRAVVQDSDVCQASIIEGFKVIKSSYYCQTEDHEPKDPGEEGKKSLLGVDSDGDGVRDDLEIFINNQLSNTPKRNRSEERKVTRVLARILQKEFLLKDNEQSIRQLDTLKLELHDCYNISQSENLYAEMYNTEDRILTLFKISGTNHGKSVPLQPKKCTSLNNYGLYIGRL